MDFIWIFIDLSFAMFAKKSTIKNTVSACSSLAFFLCATKTHPKRLTSFHGFPGISGDHQIPI